jgi:hypothetical protein
LDPIPPPGLFDLSDLSDKYYSFSSSEVQTMCDNEIRKRYPYCTAFSIAGAKFSSKPLVPNPLIDTTTDITHGA